MDLVYGLLECGVVCGLIFNGYGVFLVCFGWMGVCVVGYGVFFVLWMLLLMVFFSVLS